MLTVPFGLYLASISVTQIQVTNAVSKVSLPQSQISFDLTPKAMFTHKDKELHCPDRELIHPCTTELRRFLIKKNSTSEVTPDGEIESDHNDILNRELAYSCAKTVFEEANQDFWVVKNMTHLLLDLDTSQHFFDKNLDHDSQFFELGLQFGHKLLHHPDCLRDLDDKDPLECRCPNLYGKILLLKLIAVAEKQIDLKSKAKWNQKSDELFHYLTQEFEYLDGNHPQGKKFSQKYQSIHFEKADLPLPVGTKYEKVFKWTTKYQLPQMYMDNLYTKEVWGEDRKNDLPVWSMMEDNFEVILSEAMNAYNKSDEYNKIVKELSKLNDTSSSSDTSGTISSGKISSQQQKELDRLLEEGKKDGTSSMVNHAYSFLFQGGNWDQILLFHGREYTETCEKVFPKTCKLLKESLPNRIQHSYPWTSNQNEQVLILRLKVGTDTETHCGPSNNILNIHLGLKGTEGAKLIVAGKEYGWEVGKVIAWDGSFNHKVHCLDCKEDRYIMMIRYMHPDVSKEHYRGNRKTHFEEIPKEWIEEWERKEVEEL